MSSDNELHLAAELGDVETVKKLLTQGPIDPNLQDNKGNSPLHLAAKEKKNAVVQELLNCPGVEPNLQNYYGNTVPHFLKMRNWSITY